MWWIELQRSGEPCLARQVLLALQERIRTGQPDLTSFAKKEAFPTTAG